EIFDAQGGHNGPGGQQGQRSLVKFIPSFLVAMCAGLLGKWLNVPGGILSFSVVAVMDAATSVVAVDSVVAVINKLTI
ncbi:MAG: hypothetical protein UIL36_03000, partial [Turicibacter sp.]|nr:hypothetical protein [Turicibacter sp.]